MGTITHHIHQSTTKHPKSLGTTAIHVTTAMERPTMLPTLTLLQSTLTNKTGLTSTLKSKTKSRSTQERSQRNHITISPNMRNQNGTNQKNPISISTGLIT